MLKGRSPYNQPSRRKAEIYKLLVQTGGEARWKTLKAHLDELRLGPTTLKQTLDEMVAEGSLTKEARLGSEGAEVWYKVKVKADDIWAQLKKQLDANSANPNYEPAFEPLENLTKAIREKVEKLEGVEKESFLYDQMLEIVKMASDSYLCWISMYVRGAQWESKDQLDMVFDYVMRDVLANDAMKYQSILSEYPKSSLRAIYMYTTNDREKVNKFMQYEEEQRKANMAKRSSSAP